MIAYRCSKAGGSVDHSETYRVAVIKGTTKTLINGSLSSRFFFDTSFNDEIIIGNQVDNCAQMLMGCINYNKPITIPQSVKNCFRMFERCKNLNQSITIPPSVKNASEMFAYTDKMDNITIPMSIEDLSFFANGSYVKNFYFQSSDVAYRPIIRGIAYFPLIGAHRKNLYFNSKYNNLFNTSDTNSVVAHAITWTPMTNGFYNTEYNIYCYNNYNG